MIRLIRYTLTLFVFWLLMFVPMRLFFTLYQWNLLSGIHPHTHKYLAFVEGYPLDIATATILCGLPVLCGWCFVVFQRAFFRRLQYLLTSVLMVLYVAIALADAGIYREWLAKINCQALAHFKNPSEILKTVSITDQLLFLVLLLVLSAPFLFLYKKRIHSILTYPELQSRSKRWLTGFVFLMLYSGISVICIRGGIFSLPMSQSAAYFSNSSLANDIAVNPLYNLLQDLTVQGQAPEASQYHFMRTEDARQHLSSYFSITTDTFPIVLQTQKPNLVFIILESWSADLVSCLGGMSGATPHFDRLSKEGLLFTNCYASAYISDQGIPSVFSAYPGLSRISPISMPHVAQRMPSIVQDYVAKGYSSLFFYGGDPVFGNIKGYVVKKGFQQLVDYKNLPHLPQGQLGVHDAYSFPEFLSYCNRSKQPFLNTLFTLSTHMPYDFKETISWKGEANDPEHRYSEAIHYADEAIGRFFMEAKKQAWYKNTLFILVADHSHNTFRNSELSYADRHHIPLLWVGGALKPEWRNQRIQKVVSQLDIASTLLHQTAMDTKAYHWSRNSFNSSTTSAAYFPFFGGCGFMDDQGYASKYLLGGAINSTCSDSSSTNRHYRIAQSFLQLIYEETMR